MLLICRVRTNGLIQSQTRTSRLPKNYSAIAFAYFHHVLSYFCHLLTLFCDKKNNVGHPSQSIYPAQTSHLRDTTSIELACCSGRYVPVRPSGRASLQERWGLPSDRVTMVVSRESDRTIGSTSETGYP